MHAHYACSLADMLCQSLETTDPSVSVRLNMRKVTACMTPEQVSSVLQHLDAHYDAVPWCPHAWYLPQRPSFTFDPLLHAGAYYVQEASSMYVAEVLRRYLPLTDETPSSPLAALFVAIFLLQMKPLPLPWQHSTSVQLQVESPRSWQAFFLKGLFLSAMR